MRIEYTLENNDFLQYQLYNASTPGIVKTRRNSTKVVVPLIYLLIGFYFFINSEYFSFIIFMIISIGWFFLYPVWERGYYIRFYTKFNIERYSDRFNKLASINFTEDKLIAKEGDVISEVPFTEVKEINEIGSQIFLKLRLGDSMIIAKDKISNLEELHLTLTNISKAYNIPYNKKLDWKWK